MKIFSKILIILTILYPTFAIAEIVRAIQVTGNNRTEKSSIISYLELKVGQDYSAQKESKSIRDLYETHLFDSINISFSSGIVKVEVKETPLVVKVSSKGNKRIKSGTLAKEITTTKGTSLSKANIKTDIDKIKELYRKSGRYSVSVEAKIVPLENNRAEVIFEIKEGPKTGIKYINFIGNRNYTDSELKSVIISKESAWFRFMDSSDTYDPERFEYDKYLLKRFYNSVGFADFRIISTFPAISKSKDYFSLTFTMEEGAKYTLGTVALQSQIEAIDASLFQKFITIKTGSIYNATLIEQISENINNNLADLGYQGAVTDVSEHKNIDSKKIDLNFIILKASKIHIDKININGNLKTRDNVIRKQLKVQEGSLFNRSAINKAQQNLKDLNYFEHVDLQVAPATNKDKVDVNIEVEEKSTASVHFEIGVDSVQGPIGRVNFVETNLLGTGKHLNVGIEKTDKRTSEHLGITDPYFMDRDLLAGISLHHSDSAKSKQSPYKMSNDSVTTRLGYEIAEDLTHDIIYMLKIDKLKGSPPANSQTGENAISSMHVNEQYGTTTTSAIANSLTYDRTDSSLVPKNGYIISGTETVAGLGGDAKYMKHEATLKYFYSFWDNSYTFRISAEAGKIHGYGGSKVSINERFSLGDYTLRGFEMSGIGPRDKRTKDALGGQNMYKITAELQFPLGFPKEFGVSGALFCDVGALWGFDVKSPHLYSKSDVYNDTDPRVSYGLGLIWLTRFAPIRIDYAMPAKKKSYDVTQRWHFRLSTSF